MSGLSGLTQQIDVYAFAITVVELLTKGARLPWRLADHDAVRYFVIRDCPQIAPTPRRSEISLTLTCD